jgi:spermidine/putrescine transport system permease protein
MIGQSFSSPSGLTLDWYLAVLRDDDLIRALFTSLVLAGQTAVAAVLIGTFVALSTRKATAGSRVLRLMNALALGLPELILALSLLMAFATLGLELGPGTVWFSHVVLTSPLTALMIRTRLAALNPSLEAAARDLGAGPWQTLWLVTLPLIAPAQAAAAVLAALLSFDDFLVSFFVNGVGNDTLPVRLYTHMKVGQSPKLHALSSLLLATTLLLALPLAVFLSRIRDKSRLAPPE